MIERAEIRVKRDLQVILRGESIASADVRMDARLAMQAVEALRAKEPKSRPAVRILDFVTEEFLSHAKKGKYEHAA